MVAHSWRLTQWENASFYWRENHLTLGFWSRFHVLAAYLKFIVAKLLIHSKEKLFFFRSPQYCAKLMRANFDEIRRNRATFRRKRIFVQNFAWHPVPRTTKSHPKPRLGKQNFTQQSIRGAKPRGTPQPLEQKSNWKCCIQQFLNDQVFTETSKYTHTHWILKWFISISKQATCPQPPAFTVVTNCLQSCTEETRRFPFIPLSVSDWLIRKHHPIRDEQTARQLQAVTPKIGNESLELWTPAFLYHLRSRLLVLDGVQAEITTLKRRMANKDQRSKTHPARTPNVIEWWNYEKWSVH